LRRPFIGETLLRQQVVIFIVEHGQFVEIGFKVSEETVRFKSEGSVLRETIEAVGLGF
jgi:hypothetical protein